MQGNIDMITFLENLPYLIIGLFSGLKIFVIPAIAVVFVLALLLLWWGIHRIKGDVKARVKKLKKINKHSAVTREDNYTEIEKELEQDKILHHQWQEFIECVVSERKRQYKNGEMHYYNTIAAGNFFHFDDVVRTSNVWLLNIKFNFFTAVPSILTGLGIIGTFIGIVSSLPSSPSTEINIEAFLAGLGVSFATSITGLLLAVIFTLLENAMVDRAEHVFDEFIREIDRIFKRKSEQQYLSDIHSKLDEQSHVMKTMAAEMGGKVVDGFAKNGCFQARRRHQERYQTMVLNEFTDNLREVNEIHKQQQENTQKILDSSAALADNMEKLNNSFSNWCTDLDRASEKFGQASEGFMAKCNTLANDLGKTSENVLMSTLKCSDNIVSSLDATNNFKQEVKDFFC